MDARSLRSLARLLYLQRRGAPRLREDRVAVRVMFIWPRTREFPVYERLVPTLTIPYLAALTPRHWETSFADDNYGEVDLDARPDLVAISVSTMSAVRASNGKKSPLGSACTRGCLPCPRYPGRARRMAREPLPGRRGGGLAR